MSNDQNRTSNDATDAMVHRLQRMYPGIYHTQIYFFLEAMNFDEQATLAALVQQYGQPAPGTTVSSTSSSSYSTSQQQLGTKQLPAKYSTVVSAAPKLLPDSKKVPPGPLPTHLPGGMITSLTDMARANGCDKTQPQVYGEFIELYKKWKFRLDAEIHKSSSVSSRMRIHYVNEISRAKSARTAVETEIFEKSLWWNDYLNTDVIDLHGLLVEQAKRMLGQRIKIIKLGHRPPKLAVITGVGNNSAGGIPAIKKDLLKMLRGQGYKHSLNNEGCILIDFSTQSNRGSTFKAVRK